MRRFFKRQLDFAGSVLRLSCKIIRDNEHMVDDRCVEHCHRPFGTAGPPGNPYEATGQRGKTGLKRLLASPILYNLHMLGGGGWANKFRRILFFFFIF